MVRGFRVSVPASSANVGPAFDALAVALSTHLVVSDDGTPADETHPAVRAFRDAGGTGPLAVESRFPGGRGLGYSGAARIGGALAAAVQHEELDPRAHALEVAAALEGHADNAAASLLGGFVAVGGGRAVRVPLGLEAAVVVWVPERETATSASRRQLPATVTFDDAVFNVGRTALLVAALAAGDAAALRDATEDRLHQDRRLARVPQTAAAIDAALAAGAWCAWLSGSGPSAAALASPGDAPGIAARLPSGGRVLVLDVDTEGAVVT